MNTRHIIEVDTTKISDLASFHDYFGNLLGFPEFYGRNLDAWIDCVGDMDDPHSGLTKVVVDKGSIVCFVLRGEHDFRQRCPELYENLTDLIACVNARNGQDHIKTGTLYVLANVGNFVYEG